MKQSGCENRSMKKEKGKKVANCFVVFESSEWKNMLKNWNKTNKKRRKHSKNSFHLLVIQLFFVLDHILNQESFCFFFFFFLLLPFTDLWRIESRLGNYKELSSSSWKLWPFRRRKPHKFETHVWASAMKWKLEMNHDFLWFLTCFLCMVSQSEKGEAKQTNNPVFNEGDRNKVDN